jgi:hypothetical protein
MEVLQKKSDKNIIKLIAVIAVIVIILVFVIMLFAGNDSEKFIGTWNLDSYTSFGFPTAIDDTTITFYCGGVCRYNSITEDETGKWELRDGKLYIIDLPGLSSSYGGWDYSFSNGDKNLVLKIEMVGISAKYHLSK